MIEKIKLSIIIVNYNVSEQVLSCLRSIYDSKPKINFEIIVVDNSEKDNLREKLKNKYAEVKYIKSKINLGYGAGNNLGVSHAKGEYIFVLNPDTKLVSGKIDYLVNFIEKNKNTGAVAPILLNQDDSPHELQGMKILTPVRSIFSLSFLSKLFPKNKIYKEYFQIPWNKKIKKVTEILPGTAFVIKRNLFEEIGKFDENFFLYFEEFDLFKRLVGEGYKNYILPEVKIFHEWGSSTKLINNKNNFFLRSRFYYFKKHYGIIKALTTETFLRFNKYMFLLTLIVLIGLVIRTYNLPETMFFIPDMGPFFLLAKEMVTQGQIPLVSIETSHPWIHHGAHWVYVLAGIMLLFNFDPITPAYFIAILGTFTVLIFYLIVKEMFDKNIAILSAILFATSPLIVMNSRLPYHTSPIPFFVILLYFFTYKWLKGSVWIFPGITFLLGILYNHEITTFVFAIAIGILLFYGFYKKEVWFKKLLNVKIVTASVMSFLIPMLPMIIFDFKTGEFSQTLKFLVWVGYRVVKFPLSLIHPSFKSSGSSPSTVGEFFSFYNELVFSSSSMIAFGILLITFIFILNYFYKHLRFDKKRLFKIKKHIPDSYALLFLFTSIGLLGLSTHRVPIEADTLLISPFLIILTALSFYWFFKNKFLLSLIVFILISFVNIYALLTTNYFTFVNGQERLTFQDKVKATEKAIQISSGKPYNLKVKGVLDNFRSFSTPYEYLTWWRGHPPSSTDEKLIIIVEQKENEILVYEENKN